MIRIVVDANIILSALLGGSPRFILFDSRFEFMTTAFTMEEVEKYLPRVSEKSGVVLEEIRVALSLLPLRIYRKDMYRRALSRARKMMGHIDPCDVDILALYLAESTYLWSEDRGFEKVTPPIRILKTKNFF